MAEKRKRGRPRTKPAKKPKLPLRRQGTSSEGEIPEAKLRSWCVALGGLIEAARQRRGISSSELARQMGLSATNQFRRESGEVGIPSLELFRYAHYLKCATSTLIPRKA